MKFLVDSGADLTMKDGRGVSVSDFPTAGRLWYQRVRIWITDTMKGIYMYVVQYILYQIALFRDEYSLV